MDKARPMPDMFDDMFDGIFDNLRSGHREVWMDGRLMRYAGSNATGNTESPWRELHAQWGTYPDLPTNASIKEPA